MGQAIKVKFGSSNEKEQYLEYEFKSEMLRPVEGTYFRQISDDLKYILGLRLIPHPLLWKVYIAEYPVDINPYQQVFSLVWLYRAAKCGQCSNKAFTVISFPRLPKITQQRKWRKCRRCRRSCKLNYTIFQSVAFQESFKETLNWHIKWNHFWDRWPNSFHWNRKNTSESTLRSSDIITLWVRVFQIELCTFEKCNIFSVIKVLLV